MCSVYRKLHWTICIHCNLQSRLFCIVCSHFSVSFSSQSMHSSMSSISVMKKTTGMSKDIFHPAPLPFAFLWHLQIYLGYVYLHKIYQGNTLFEIELHFWKFAKKKKTRKSQILVVCFFFPNSKNNKNNKRSQMRSL